MRMIRLGQGKVQIFCTYLEEDTERYFVIVFREQDTSREIGFYPSLAGKRYKSQENDVIIRIDNKKSMQVLFDIVEIAAIEFKINPLMNKFSNFLKLNRPKMG